MVQSAEKVVINYDIAKQTHAVIRNVEAVLKSAGGTLADIVDIQVFLTNMKKDFNTFNEVYTSYFKEHRPSRTTVEVGSLPTPINVEFKVVARICG